MLSNGFYQNTNSSVKEQSEDILTQYNIEISPKNATIIQGEKIALNVTVNLLQGKPQNLTFIVVGIPKGAEYSFIPSMGYPAFNSTFNSILMIYTSEAVPTNYYNITIIPVADKVINCSAQFDLSIINSKILVSGTVNGPSGVLPKQIVFDLLYGPPATFTASVDSGRFSVSLLNKHLYSVTVQWDNQDGTKGTHHFILPFNLDAGIGVNSLTYADFHWS
jgi:hypothetical protein